MTKCAAFRRPHQVGEKLSLNPHSFVKFLLGGGFDGGLGGGGALGDLPDGQPFQRHLLHGVDPFPVGEVGPVLVLHPLVDEPVSGGGRGVGHHDRDGGLSDLAGGKVAALAVLHDHSSISGPMPNDGLKDEYDTETFTVNGVGDNVATPAQYTVVSVIDKDAPPKVTLSAGGTLTEGTAFPVPITLDHGSELPVTVQWNAGAPTVQQTGHGLATPGTDFAYPPADSSRILSFAPGAIVPSPTLSVTPLKKRTGSAVDSGTAPAPPANAPPATAPPATAPPAAAPPAAAPPAAATSAAAASRSVINRPAGGGSH